MVKAIKKQTAIKNSRAMIFMLTKSARAIGRRKKTRANRKKVIFKPLPNKFFFSIFYFCLFSSSIQMSITQAVVKQITRKYNIKDTPTLKPAATNPRM